MELGLESIKRSYTSPDCTSIRIYYSPPAVRRMEPHSRQDTREKQQAQRGHPSLVLTGSGTGLEGGMQNPSSISPPSSSSSYEQWLSSLSTQHQELLKKRGSARSASSGNGDIVASSAAFHGLDISANLSDDMKEMTNCVRQAIQSSSLERKVSASGKESIGSVMAVEMASHSTQTVTQYANIGLQTDTPSRGSGIQSKAWLPRPSSTTTSVLAAARSRQISSSLDKVHSRIDRPCCSPKYGSPKLQRRVSSGSTSRLEGSSRERSLWSLQPRGVGGSAWARSTTTRDSPVLSGLNDGLSSLFSVVEHSGSVESLWRGDGAVPSQGTSPATQPPAAGKPSGAASGTEFQEFLRNICGGRAQGGSVLPGEKLQRESLGLSGLEVDEAKLEGVSGVVGLAGIGGNDNVNRIVQKRFMRHTVREETAVIGGKEYSSPRELPMSSTTEDAACGCASQSLTSSLTRPSRSTTRPPLGHCTHRLQESPTMTDERADHCIE
ncbi:microtubule cross-linking factor 2-like [Aplochiton taeniatus]